MTTLEKLLHLISMIDRDHQFIFGADLRMGYVATDMRKIKERYRIQLFEHEGQLAAYPQNHINAAYHIYSLRRQ